jgi:NADH-quinone oxidoreductase subunit E
MDNDRIDQIIDKHQAEPSSLIQVMLEIQSENNWLPKTALDRISERLDVPLARILHIATFYKAFSLVPKGRHGIHICVGTACHVRGASRILDTVQDKTGIKPGRNGPGFEVQPGGRELSRLLCAWARNGNRWKNPWQNDAG